MRIPRKKDESGGDGVTKKEGEILALYVSSVLTWLG